MFKKTDPKVQIKVERVEEVSINEKNVSVRLRKNEDIYEVKISKYVGAGPSQTFDFIIGHEAAFALGTELQRLHKEVNEVPAGD